MTLNALRKYLRDSGCLEERELRVAGRDSMFIAYVCRTKRKITCRAFFAVDVKGGELPDQVVADLGRYLSPCLGRRWIMRVPNEDPFG